MPPFRLSYSLKRVVDSAVTAEKADINLKHQSASGRITGRAVISATPTGKAADRTALTLKPDLTAQGDALRGTAEVMVKQGRKQAFRGTISLSLQPGVLPAPASPDTTLDLERLDAASLDAARNTLADAMAKHLKTLLMRLDRAERLKVLHDIGRDARTEGPVAPLTDLALPDQQQPTTPRTMWSIRIPHDRKIAWLLVIAMLLSLPVPRLRLSTSAE